MKKIVAAAFVVLLLTIVFVPAVSAHSPVFSEGNDTLESAHQINDPEKSWVMYGHLQEGESDYYKMNIEEGQTISLKMIIPPEYFDHGFIPEMTLIGPGLPSDSLELKADFPDDGAITVEGTKVSSPEYEPFTPSASYTVAELEIKAPQSGEYYIQIFDNEHLSGNYGLTIGERESFTLKEWLTIPLNSIKIYHWEGQGILEIFAVAIITFAGGLAIMLLRKTPEKNRLWILATIGGLLLIASGFSFLYQMIWSLVQSGIDTMVWVTPIFIAIPIILGLLAIRTSEKKFSKRTRLYLFLIGIISLFLWGGWIIGPIMLMVSALLPKKWLLHNF